MKLSDRTVTFVNKTTNLYYLTKAEHDPMINNAITLKYNGKLILKNKEVLNRLEINGENYNLYNSARSQRKF